jgi:hypothetical protein
MAYITSSAPASETVGVCDVHRLVDGDARPRPVNWCGICHAWLCAACSHDLAKRAKAMMIRVTRGKQ